jgi:hypothetical protein
MKVVVEMRHADSSHTSKKVVLPASSTMIALDDSSRRRHERGKENLRCPNLASKILLLHQLL